MEEAHNKALEISIDTGSDEEDEQKRTLNQQSSTASTASEASSAERRTRGEGKRGIMRDPIQGGEEEETKTDARITV